MRIPKNNKNKNPHLEYSFKVNILGELKKLKKFSETPPPKEKIIKMKIGNIVTTISPLFLEENFIEFFMERKSLKL